MAGENLACLEVAEKFVGVGGVEQVATICL